MSFSHFINPPKLTFEYFLFDPSSILWAGFDFHFRSLLWAYCFKVSFSWFLESLCCIKCWNCRSILSISVVPLKFQITSFAQNSSFEVDSGLWTNYNLFLSPRVWYQDLSNFALKIAIRVLLFQRNWNETFSKKISDFFLSVIPYTVEI